MASGSKFRGIFDAAHEPEPEPEPGPEPGPPAHPPAGNTNPGNAPPSAVSAGRRVGRPPVGKKSDPSYTQVTAYVRRDLYRDVRIALLQDGSGQDFSELVDQLLQRWRDERFENSDAVP